VGSAVQGAAGAGCSDGADSHSGTKVQGCLHDSKLGLVDVG
jgi:hypothetical protein